jgi:hypothetical protein
LNKLFETISYEEDDIFENVQVAIATLVGTWHRMPPSGCCCYWHCCYSPRSRRLTLWHLAKSLNQRYLKEKHVDGGMGKDRTS